MTEVITLDVLRLQRNGPKKCKCKVPRYTIDPDNMIVYCDCGFVHNPFHVLLEFANRHEEINRKQRRMAEQAKQWIKEKPHSVIFKSLERHYAKGTMFPFCPECNQLFDFKDVTRYGNPIFYKNRKAKEVTHEQNRRD